VDTLEIILVVAAVLLALLALGGYVAQKRRMERREPRFEADLRQVNEDLAAAHAQDRGWERSALEDAARRAYADQRAGAQPQDMALVQVIDRPGTDEDKAVFRFVRDGREEHLTLGRQDGAWVYETLR
jgi:hypothetical protein